MFLARDGEAHVMIEPEFLLGLSEKALELWVGQEGDRDDESAPVFTDIHGEVTLWDVDGEIVVVVAAIVGFFAKA